MTSNPVVAIIGRPNVGKSTLFNRIAGKQKAIVIDEPGATRDRNYIDCVWQDKAFTLIDTGGFEPASEDEIYIQMREQTYLAIEEADSIIFLMDGKEGLTASDMEISRLLRGKDKNVYHVANKVDGEKHENLLVDFYRLGIDDIHAISAQHGLGINELLSAVTELFPSLKEIKQSDDTQIKIAIVGKPNVGKSSLINLLSGKNRTIANPAPGTTRDAIDLPLKVHGKHYLLIDTAGIRKKNKISLTLEKYSVIQALKSINRCNVALVLIDAEEGITEQDAKIAGLAYERGKACIIVVNKWDKIKKDNAIVGKYVEEIKETLKFMDFAPIIFISAVTGQRAPKIFNIIDDIYNQYTKRVDTPALNTFLENITRKNPLPLYQNKRVRIFYATQVDIKPPSFVFFVSAVKGIHFSYRRFLTNQIREKFDFNVVPIKIIFRKKR